MRRGEGKKGGGGGKEKEEEKEKEREKGKRRIVHKQQKVIHSITKTAYCFLPTCCIHQVIQISNTFITLFSVFIQYSTMEIKWCTTEISEAQK